jgi:hypothetical protein
MIIPTKFTRFGETALSAAAIVLAHVTAEIPLIHLYHETESKIGDLDRFLFALDILYVFGRIDLDQKRGVISLAD